MELSKNKKTVAIQRIGASVGALAGVAYAFKVKSGFWKGWGYSILGGLLIGGLAYGIGLALEKPENDAPEV